MRTGCLTLLRIKSTLGEPSWFSAVGYSLFLPRPSIQAKVAFRSATFLHRLFPSTSAFIAFSFALILYGVFRRKISASLLVPALLFAGAFASLYFSFPETFNEMFTAKFRGENTSGQGRMDHSAAANDAEAAFTLLNRIFGIGFGYHYGGVFFAVLMNTGWIGMVVYCYAF